LGKSIKRKEYAVIALAFGKSETYQHLKINDIIDIVYYLEINEFNGREDVQLKIIDIKTNV
jgi:hypothetical protein